MYDTDFVGSENRFDAVLIGSGIMSATLGVLLHELDPSLRLLMVERLEAPGRESTCAVNNAGTGHAANCELNYTPLKVDGSLEISKALEINAAFERSLEFWASLTEMGKLSPNKFLNFLPHISCVWGDLDVAFLDQRFTQMRSAHAFSNMQFTQDRSELAEWMPLVMDGREIVQPVAATRVQRGTDVDFGALTYAYLAHLQKHGSFELKLNTEVLDLERDSDELWGIDLQAKAKSFRVKTPFVFLGAGGGALPLLQRSGIPEASQFGGFPVSGQWLVCSDISLTNQHHAKVYGKAQVGAPPMSVPHLDTRWISGQRSLLFGPFAGFSSKFLKYGSRLDLIRSIRLSNLVPMLQVGLDNFNLVNYLVDQLQLSEADRLNALKDFLPTAKAQEWKLSVAGQRVQIIKKTSRGGVLQMGTEVVSSVDGSLAALLGASPGASTAVSIMLEVLKRCWPERMSSPEWQIRLKELLPSLGEDINSDAGLLRKTRQRNNALLGFS